MSLDGKRLAAWVQPPVQSETCQKKQGLQGELQENTGVGAPKMDFLSETLPD